jgi:hypothetical protein
MSDCEIIPVSTGYLIGATAYGSLAAALSAVKCIRELLKSDEIGAVSLQFDRNLQPLLDKAWLKREQLTPTCEVDPLMGKKGNEFCIYSRRDMAFLFFVVNYAHKYKRIPCFTTEDFTTGPGERLKSSLSRLYDLYSLHGEIAHVCSESQAKNLRTFFLAQ